MHCHSLLIGHFQNNLKRKIHFSFYNMVDIPDIYIVFKVSNLNVHLSFQLVWAVISLAFALSNVFSHKEI